MKKIIIICLIWLAVNNPVIVRANDSFQSEISHAAGGAAIAGAVTYISDSYWSSKYRGWIGFGVSTLIGIAGEVFDSGNQFSLLDASSHAAGAAIGAWVTDKWILMPVVNIGPDNKVASVGAIAQLKF